MKNYDFAYFDNIEYLENITKDTVIAEGDGDFMNEIANRVAEHFDYDSMWLYNNQPIFKPKRTYLLCFDGNYLTVSRNFKIEKIKDVHNLPADDIRGSYEKLVHKYGKDIVDNTLSKMINERNQQKKNLPTEEDYELVGEDFEQGL